MEGPELNLKLQYFGYLMQKADSLEKDCDAGKDWRQKEMGATEDEVVIQHHQLTDMNLSKCQGTVKDKEGLACCDSWAHKESHMTEQLNWTKLNSIILILQGNPHQVDEVNYMITWL